MGTIPTFTDSCLNYKIAQFQCQIIPNNIHKNLAKTVPTLLHLSTPALLAHAKPAAFALPPYSPRLADHHLAAPYHSTPPPRRPALRHCFVYNFAKIFVFLSSIRELLSGVRASILQFEGNVVSLTDTSVKYQKLPQPILGVIALQIPFAK